MTSNRNSKIESNVKAIYRRGSPKKAKQRLLYIKSRLSMALPLLLLLQLLAAQECAAAAVTAHKHNLIHNSASSSSSNVTDSTTASSNSWRIITRTEWKARAPTTKTYFTGPAPYVILHHSYNPGECLSVDACKAAMRSMQNYHMDGHGWPDIGYTYAVGGDGNIYEARGYNVVGAHAPNYNSQSIGLLLIGNFVNNLPPTQMLQVAQEFIKYSVKIGQLREDYILYGHRQVRSTDCPGDALFAEIQKWEHWRPVE